MMRCLSLNWLLGVVLALAVGCKSAPTPTPAAEPTAPPATAAPATPAVAPAPAPASAPPVAGFEEAAIDEMVGYFTEMTTILEENAADPKAVAAKLDALYAAKRDRIEAIKRAAETARAGLTPAQQKELGSQLLAKLKPAMDRLLKVVREHPGLTSDPEVNRAMAQFSQP